MNRVASFVERVLRDRPPRPFRAGPADAEAMAMAVGLRSAARPPAEPSAEFTERLRGELAARLGSPAAGQLTPAPAPAGPSGTRRGVVAAAGLAAAAGVAGGYLARGGTEGPAPGTEPVLRPETGAWQTVARSQDLPEGAVTGFDTGTVTGFVGRSAGRVFAISGVCTHLGCKLALDGPARELRCPCHLAAFTLTGTVRSHPRTGTLPPLPRIPVRESGGAVQVFTAVASR